MKKIIKKILYWRPKRGGMAQWPPQTPLISCKVLCLFSEYLVHMLTDWKLVLHVIQALCKSESVKSGIFGWVGE